MSLIDRIYKEKCGVENFLGITPTRLYISGKLENELRVELANYANRSLLLKYQLRYPCLFIYDLEVFIVQNDENHLAIF